MGLRHKCFISYKKEDLWYKDELIHKFGGENFIDKTLNEKIDSEDDDYICEVIRREHLKDSTVTLALIGKHSSEKEGKDVMKRDKNFFIKWELQASLFNGSGNTRNGILGIVLPEMYAEIYKGPYRCTECGGEHNWVNINDSTVIREFSVNYYINFEDSRCCWGPDDRYCILVRWDDFFKNPNIYIEEAFEKRNSKIADKVRSRNLR